MVLVDNCNDDDAEYDQCGAVARRDNDDNGEGEEVVLVVVVKVVMVVAAGVEEDADVDDVDNGDAGADDVISADEASSLFPGAFSYVCTSLYL